MVPDDRDLNFDKTVYSVKIYVTDEGGALTAAVIASAEGDKSGDKLQRLKFVNTVPDKEQTTTAAQKDDSSNDKNRNPKTEDDTRMENQLYRNGLPGRRYSTQRSAWQSLF